MTTHLSLQHGTKISKKRSRTQGAARSIAKRKHTVALFPAHTQPDWPSPAHIALSSCALTVISAKSTCLSLSVWISRKTDSPVSSHMPPISAALVRCCLQLALVWIHCGTGGCCVCVSDALEREKVKKRKFTVNSQPTLKCNSRGTASCMLMYRKRPTYRTENATIWFTWWTTWNTHIITLNHPSHNSSKHFSL